MIERSGWNMNEITDVGALEEKVSQLTAEGKLGFVPMKKLKADMKKLKAQLPPIPYDWSHIMQLCMQRQFASKTLAEAFIVLPVGEHMDTKKNKARLVQDDASSPVGSIDKTDSFARIAYQPFASAKFRTDELIRWLVTSGKVVDEQVSSVS